MPNQQHMLVPNAFEPLRLGELTPESWLRRQLEIQAAGLSGHLDEFWPDIADSGWIGGKAEAGSAAPTGWTASRRWLSAARRESDRQSAALDEQTYSRQAPMAGWGRARIRPPAATNHSILAGRSLPRLPCSTTTPAMSACSALGYYRLEHCCNAPRSLTGGACAGELLGIRNLQAHRRDLAARSGGDNRQQGYD